MATQAARLANTLRQFGAAYLATHHLSTPQARAWRAIVACRTAALGGAKLACDHCKHEHWQYHSCRNRHCPQCGARAKDAWLQGRLAEALPVPYAHLVFTLPHSLNSLYGVDPRWVIDTLFAATAQTLTEFTNNPKWIGGAVAVDDVDDVAAVDDVDANANNGVDGSRNAMMPAFTLMLHTWTQDLRRHIHVHAVMACGALDGQGKWHYPVRKPNFLFPVEALSCVFRGKFMAALKTARQTGQLERDPEAEDSAWSARQKALYRHQWVVYAKTPLGGSVQVLDYLSRYTHRTAISNERIIAMNDRDVLISVRANEKGGKRRERIEGGEFVWRIMLHVLPTGIKRIRHYGLLASACKTARLAEARAALAMPLINPRALESARDFMQRVAKIDVLRCPDCLVGTLKVAAVVASLPRLPSPAEAVRRQACRGPP